MISDWILYHKMFVTGWLSAGADIITTRLTAAIQAGCHSKQLGLALTGTNPVCVPHDHHDDMSDTKSSTRTL